MKLTINLEGVERTYAGDYHELHARDWNERVREMLDEMQDVNEGKV